MGEQRWSASANCRPETRVLGEYLYHIVEQWSDPDLVYWTARESDTLEVAAFQWTWGPRFFATQRRMYAYIHYDTQVLWLWYGNGRVIKCETEREFERAARTIWSYYMNGGLHE